MRHLEATPREEMSIGNSLADEKGFCALIVAMVRIRLAGNPLVRSEAFLDAQNAVGKRYYPATESTSVSMGSSFWPLVSTKTAGYINTPDEMTWLKHVDLLEKDLSSQHPLRAFFEVAGFQPSLELSDHRFFPADFDKFSARLACSTGITLSLARRSLGGRP